MRFVKSFRDAFRGIVYGFQHERNFRVQCFLGILVIIFSFVFSLRSYEKIILAMMIAFVLVLELLNTTIEMFLDLLKPRLSPQVEAVKDIMAGAVLIASIGSILVGGIIFFPYIVELIY
jgi:diacylglycerol kinase